jgi:phage-related protein (TIGR01555 family)
MAIKKKASTTKKTNLDGWSNVITGLNIAGIDKNKGAQVDWKRTDRDTAESLFSADDIGGKIAKLLPYDGIREGITWALDEDSEDDATDTIKFLNSEFERLEAWKTFGWAWTVARVYGGSIVLMLLDDGMELDEPVVESKVRKIQSLRVIDRWALTITSADIIGDLTDPMFGTPEFYTYNTSNDAPTSAQTVRIHNSRVIRFDGEILPQRLYIRNNYWHDSIYGRLYNAIRNYSTSHDNISSIIQEINQPVYTIDGLNEALAQDSEELVLKKLNFVNLLRSSMRAIILDGSDTFTNQAASVAGVSDLASMIEQRLIAASEYPHTRLMGESPGSSLGEGGRSQLTDYYDVVKAQQQTILRMPINRLTDLLFSQSEDRMVKPDGLGFTFDPLYQQDQKTLIETRKIQADTDAIYMDRGVYDSNETAESRFGSGEYSYETRLDQEERMADDEEEVETQQPAPEPEPEPEPETQEEQRPDFVDNFKHPIPKKKKDPDD